MKHPHFILPTIVFSQFCCTSLWFAGNGVMGDLLVNFSLDQSALGHLTSAVQVGFILGTLVFAVLSIADRFSPSKVFFACAMAGAFFNLGVVWDGNGLGSLLGLRFATGFFLAGIYPVGMKIAADYYKQGLGRSLGFLVGALVLGTAFPHLAKHLTGELPWKAVLVFTSVLAVAGGFRMLVVVPDGPHRKPGTAIRLSAFLKVFRKAKFRSAAFGYFGHMWELYAFWTFLPVMLATYAGRHADTDFSFSLLSFLIIGVGGLACVTGGYLAEWLGARLVAFASLLLSGLCCLVSPLVFGLESDVLFIGFLFFWGMVVIADSPLFSTLVAQNAAAEIKGTALTIVNCLGFSITIVSIQLLTYLQGIMDPSLLYMILAIGPALGLLAFVRKGEGP